MEFITAKFNSKCAETFKAIKKGEEIAYDRANKKAYCKGSNAFAKAKIDGREAKNISDYVDAQEDAYFDNFCQNNNI